MNPQELVEQFGPEAILMIASTLFNMQPEELQQFLEALEQMVNESQGGQQQVPPEEQQAQQAQQNLFG